MRYEYLIDTRGMYVAPWADTTELKDQRDECFIEAFGIRPLIVSPDFWERLLSKYEVQILITEEE